MVNERNPMLVGICLEKTSICCQQRYKYVSIQLTRVWLKTWSGIELRDKLFKKKNEQQPNNIRTALSSSWAQLRGWQLSGRESGPCMSRKMEDWQHLMLLCLCVWRQTQRRLADCVFGLRFCCAGIEANHHRGLNNGSAATWRESHGGIRDSHDVPDWPVKRRKNIIKNFSPFQN